MMKKWLIEKKLRKLEKKSKLLMTKKFKYHRHQTIKDRYSKPFYRVKKLLKQDIYSNKDYKMEVVKMAERHGEWTLKVRSRYRSFKQISIAWMDKTKMHKMMIVMNVMAVGVELSFRMLSLLEH